VETLLGVPVQVILIGSVAATIVAAASLAVLAWRRPLLARLAARNPGRRPIQSLLIALGLALSTIITSTAFNTGDTMTHTVRSLVSGSLGRADEVVLALPRDRRRSPAEYLAALVDGSLLTGLGAYFPEQRATDLRVAAAGDERIAGLLPAIGEQVTIVNLDLQMVAGPISVLALPPDYPAAFGVLRSPDGTLALAGLEGNELLASVEAAAQLGAEAGSRLELRTPTRALSYTVRGIVNGTELVGTRPTLVVSLAAYQQAIGREGQINQILVANTGDQLTSFRHSEAVSRTLRSALADPTSTTRLFELLRSAPARGQLAEAARSTEGREREKLESLARSLERDAPSAEFIGLATDPQLERRLFQLAGRLGGGVAGFAPAP
jgi:hypothetical protein